MKMSVLTRLRNCLMVTTLVTSSLIADDATPAFKVGPELTKVPLDDIEAAYQGKTPPEAIRMYLAIARGSRMGAGEGWFGPANQRYTWDWLANRHEVSSKEGISADKFQGSPAGFARLDRDRDGQITRNDLDWSERNSWVQHSYLVNRLFRRLDPNGDGKLTHEEWSAFFDAASHGKPEISFDELRDSWLSGMSGGFLPGDAPSTEILLKGLFAGEVGSLQEGPPLDAPAPDFTLKTVNGKETIQLSKLIGPKPIVLVFGNFTCGPFRSMYPEVEAVSRRFKNEATFLGVYVREAHPTDGWKMESNAKVGVAVAQPKTDDERTAVAQQCHLLLKPTIPLLVDTVDDRTGNAYSGMPARLYVIDTQGRVAYKGGRGPFGFKCGEMEQALVMTLLDGMGDKAAVKGVEPPMEKAPAVPLLSLEECWKRLPTTISGGGQTLPIWVRAVANHLPRTAAAMLQLDLAQRTKSPLDPVLRAKMRWVVAHANRCAYSEAYALADLKRAGLEAQELETLTGDPAAWLEADRDPLEFARLLTVAAPTIPDELFEKLKNRFGEKKTAAMVLLAAYGNFQDRIVLGLNLPIEVGGPLPPLVVQFADNAFQIASLFPPQSKLSPLEEPGNSVVPEDREWSQITYQELQARLERQRDRKSRLPIPTWDEVKRNLPPAMAVRPTRIVWNLICSGYVPELAIPWSISTRTMWAETKPDRIFEESLFWIQTRSIECNYCMGHCEMLLEVAGLDKKAVAERTSKLASSDWSAFPPAEQRAFAYARKLSKTPWELTTSDYSTLDGDLGSDKAMATFWWLCRGLYMTRISDGFQLPLERENVFEAPSTKSESPK